MAMSNYQRRNKQTTTEDVRSLDIRKLNKKCFSIDGWIDNYQCSDGELLQYRIDADRIIISSKHQTISLDKTRCHYGGFRYWFKCPQCHTRSGVLYYLDSEFLCRQCHRLPYATQREEKIDRLIRKLRKMRRRVGASTNLSIPILSKPKGMHWQTFRRLLEHEKCINQQYAHAVIRYLGINEEFFFS